MTKFLWMISVAASVLSAGQVASVAPVPPVPLSRRQAAFAR